MDDDNKPCAGMSNVVDVTDCSVSEHETTLGADPETDQSVAEPSIRKDFLRKRNALYARRKYARRKIESNVLQDQCLQIEENNHYLRLEESRLRGLLERAKQVAQIYDQQQLRSLNGSMSFSPSLSLPSLGSTDLMLMQALARQQGHASSFQCFEPSLLSPQTYLPFPGGLPHEALRLHSLYADVLRAGQTQAFFAGAGQGYSNGSSLPPASDLLNNLLFNQRRQGQLSQHQRQHGRGDSTNVGGKDQQSDQSGNNCRQN
ncbi:hypothetical protein MPSEU_000734700 [Mayamaea pseudoterrestris]|nr:hypothetical protein MPSEU_000734700 [Mayamaea pseudoterrestris]